VSDPNNLEDTMINIPKSDRGKELTTQCRFSRRIKSAHFNPAVKFSKVKRSQIQSANTRFKNTAEKKQEQDQFLSLNQANSQNNYLQAYI